MAKPFKENIEAISLKKATKVRKVRLAKGLVLSVGCDNDGEVCCPSLKNFLVTTLGNTKIKKHPARVVK